MKSLQLPFSPPFPLLVSPSTTACAHHSRQKPVSPSFDLTRSAYCLANIFLSEALHLLFPFSPSTLSSPATTVTVRVELYLPKHEAVSPGSDPTDQ